MLRFLWIVVPFVGVLSVTGHALSAEGGRQPEVHGQLFPFCDEGKWGYMNWDGVVRIAPQFEWADEFSEGLAEASSPSQRRSGYINDRGEFVFLVPEKGPYYGSEWGP